MKTYILLISFFFLLAFKLSAQHEADNWYFGDRAGISFQSGSPVQITNGKLSTQEGCAVISDKITGKLLFYTNGDTVWNGNHTIVANGTGLKGGISGSQSALIVPNPANSLEYYIFTTPDLTAGNTPVNTALFYSLISVANPDCDILLKNVFLIDSVSEKLTGTLDCSETGFWIVAQDVSKNYFYSFHVTEKGVDPKATVSFFEDIQRKHTQGCMKFSPDGTKLAVATTSLNDTPFLALFDFNRITGAVTNYNQLGSPNTSVLFFGVSFSPDNKLLYALGKTNLGLPLAFSGLFQYDLTFIPSSNIQSSEIVFPVRALIPFKNSAMQIAPDGKIYIVSGDRSYMDVINNPTVRGSGCNYQADAINFQKYLGRGLPNFMDYLFGNHCFNRSCNVNGVGNMSIICAGSSVKIGNRPISGFTYSWAPTDGLSNPNISDPFASPSVTTEYTLKITSSTCESYQTFLVKIAEKITVDSVLPLCAGASVQLSAKGDGTYSWFPAEDMDTASKANPIATPKGNTRYKVINIQGNCVDSAFVSVHVFPKFTANAGEDKRICLSESVQIGDTAKEDEKYFWYPPEGLDDVTLPNPIATPKATTRYVVQVTRNGCIAYDTVLVTVIIVKPVVSKDVTICKGTSAQLTASGGKVYSWLPVTGLNNPRIPNPIASPSVTTKYRVRISNGNCVDSAFVTVFVHPSFKANAGIDQTICTGESVQLGELAEAGKIYSWQPPIYLDDPKKANPTCTPNASTTYILTVTNTNGCKEYDTASVSVKNQKANAGVDKTICTGSKTQLGALPETGATYLWNPATDLNDPTKSNPTASPPITTLYILKVTSSSGCIGYDTVFVNVGNKLTAITSGDTGICYGASAQLSASGGSEYEWSPVTGLDNPNIANPIASPAITTTYKVRVLSGICKDSTQLTVKVNPPPIAIAGADVSHCTGEISQLGALPIAGNTYQWQPAAGLDDPTKSNPSANPTSTTNYILTVTNSSGCTTVDSVLVSIGTIEATISADTTVCRGSSLQLNAGGGSTYQWFPSAGLDNPAISNPLCTPNVSTQYRVIVANGSCLDTAFVTVTLAEPPIAHAGVDHVICVGENVELGGASTIKESYSWTPVAGLSSPTSSNTVAKPTETTTYILKVTNQYGCFNHDTVVVVVNPSNERSFSLTPPVIKMMPGVKFNTTLQIPKDVQFWKANLRYDNLVMKFDSIIETTNGIVISPPKEQNGELSLRGSGENGSIVFSFYSFLPYNSDTSFAINLSVDSLDDNQCASVVTKNNTLVLDMFCGRAIRNVSSTGKNYFLTSKENNVNFGIGLPGKVRLELYDYTGALKEVLTDDTFDAGEYSLDFDLPVGVYFCKINAGIYNDVQKIVVTTAR